MRHTRETVRRHLSPWVLIVWAALIGLASIADRFEIGPGAQIEDLRHD